MLRRDPATHNGAHGETVNHAVTVGYCLSLRNKARVSGA